jgi:hypothetical protein
MPLRGQQNTYRRLYSQQPQQPAQSQGSLQLRSRRARSQQQQQNLITMEEAKMWKDMTRGEKVVYATKQTSYAGIVMAGLAITGGLFYMVGSELFSSNNASGVYNRALEMVKSNQEVRTLICLMRCDLRIFCMLFSCRIYWGLLFPGSKNIVGEVGRSW